MLPTTIMEVYLGTALKNVGEIIGVTKDSRPIAPHMPKDSELANATRTDGAGPGTGLEHTSNPWANHSHNVPDGSKEARENMVFWAGLIFTILSAVVLTLYVKRKLNAKIEELERKRQAKKQLEAEARREKLEAAQLRRSKRQATLRRSSSRMMGQHRRQQSIQPNPTSNPTIAFTTSLPTQHQDPNNQDAALPDSLA
jgi:cell division protein FtsL